MSGWTEDTEKKNCFPSQYIAPLPSAQEIKFPSVWKGRLQCVTEARAPKIDLLSWRVLILLLGTGDTLEYLDCHLKHE